MNATAVRPVAARLVRWLRPTRTVLVALSGFVLLLAQYYLRVVLVGHRTAWGRPLDAVLDAVNAPLVWLVARVVDPTGVGDLVGGTLLLAYYYLSAVLVGRTAERAWHAVGSA